VVDVLRSSGVEVIGMVSIFSYRFQVAQDAFEQAGVPFYSLADYSSLLDLASRRGMISADEQEVLLKWRMDPANWTGVF
ncbi:MAG TPA: orotate phosphoribosyltransferase, partial [Flavisolibacter sp.]